MTPQEIAGQRRRRVNEIRQTVAIIAVGAFLAFFAVISIRMSRGHDPALAATQAAKTTPVQTQTTTQTQSDDTLLDTTPNTTQDASPPAMTTSQS
jgi:hypothetical protein